MGYVADPSWHEGGGCVPSMQSHALAFFPHMVKTKLDFKNRQKRRKNLKGRGGSPFYKKLTLVKEWLCLRIELKIDYQD